MDGADFSTLSRRQKTLAVKIPYRGSKGPLHLLIPSHGLQANHCRAVDSTGIKAPSRQHPADAPAGQWRAKASGMRANTAVPTGASGARSISGLMRKHWRSALSRSPGAISVTHRCYPICSARSRTPRARNSAVYFGVGFF